MDIRECLSRHRHVQIPAECLLYCVAAHTVPRVGPPLERFEFSLVWRTPE